jgi:hypothetical protein
VRCEESDSVCICIESRYEIELLYVERYPSCGRVRTSPDVGHVRTSRDQILCRKFLKPAIDIYVIW